jgi:hypothetical protein
VCGAVLCVGQENHAGAFFVVAGQVVEAIFLVKNVGLSRFFAARVTPKNDRPVYFCGDPGAALGVDAIGFALAVLLGLGDGEKENRAKQSRKD